MPKRSRFPIIRAKWPRIVDYRGTRLGCLMVDGRRRGNGRREYFKDESDAELRAEQLAIERENHGTAALNLSARDRVMAEECQATLRPFGKTLRDATQHYVDWLKADAVRAESPLIRDCVREFIHSRERDVRRGDLAERSLAELRHCCTHLNAAVGDVRIVKFELDAAQSYLDAFPVSARTRHNIRLRLSKFFNFCRSKKWITTNPCAEIKIKVRRGEVAILSVDDAEQLLHCAEASKHADVLVPYVAVCLFGGLRPFEVQQLEWKQINFETQTTHVLAHTSKRRESRYVHMEPALVRWLQPYANTNRVRLCAPNFRRQWRQLVKSAGYGSGRPWPQDVMRHTAASMLLAIKRNRALVAEELGTSVDVLRRHYRRPILRAEAERFWSLSSTSS